MIVGSLRVIVCKLLFILCVILIVFVCIFILDVKVFWLWFVRVVSIWLVWLLLELIDCLFKIISLGDFCFIILFSNLVICKDLSFFFVLIWMVLLVFSVKVVCNCFWDDLLLIVIVIILVVVFVFFKWIVFLIVIL